MKSNSIKNLPPKCLAGFSNLKVFCLFLFLSLWGFSSAQNLYIWNTPQGNDTLVQNKKVLLVQLDTNSFGIDLLNIIALRPEIDSIYYSHYRSDTAKGYFVLKLDSAISDSLFHRSIVLLDTFQRILKVSEILGDTGQFITTSTIIVKLLNRADSTSLKNRLLSHACTVQKIYEFDSLIWFVNVNNPDSNSIQISRKLHESGLFEFAEPNLAILIVNTSSTNDPLLGNQWHLNNTGSNHHNYPGCSLAGEDISAYDAWDINTGCQYQIIAILDDGIWPFHPDLNCVNYGQNALLADPFYKYKRDFLNYNAIPDDSSHKHGTRCAGIATAIGNNSSGVAGVAYDTKVVGIKILSSTGYSSCIVLAAAYDIAETIGADIVSGSIAIYNNSLVRNYPLSSHFVSDRIKHIVQNGRNGLGTPVVHSTGNGTFSHVCQTGVPIVGFPATDTNTIAVTSSDYCGDIVTNTYFSYCADYGGNTFVSAPGVEVMTTGVVFFGGPYWNCDFFQGTSAATPIVAGTVGLILATNPMLNYRQVKSILANSADQITYTYNNATGATHPWNTWSPEFGYGRVNAANAADMALNTKFTLFKKLNGVVTEITSSSVTVQSADILNFRLMVKIPTTIAVYSTIIWHRNGVPIHTGGQEFRPDKPGIYRVEIINSCMNTSVFSEDVEVIFTCAASSSYSNTTIVFSPLSGQLYTLDGTIHIGGNVTFTDCFLMMKSGSQIIVDAGYTLTLDNTQVTSCDRWIGVRVPTIGSTRGYLVMSQNSLISMAIIGVSLEYGGRITADDSRFEDNEMHMAFDYWPTWHQSFISNCTFGFLSTPSGNSHPHSFGNARSSMIFLDFVSDIVFEYNTFLSLDYFGLTNPTDMELIYVEDILIKGNTFGTDNSYAIHMTDMLSAAIFENTFSYKNLPVTAVPGSNYDYNAIYAYNSESLDISGNSFLGCTEGLQFYQDLYPSDPSTIIDNTFRYNNNALIISPHEHPLNALSGANDNCSTYLNNINLLFYCNDFENNVAGVLASGSIIDQIVPATPSSLGVGNDFVNNNDWDLLWVDCAGSNFRYFDARNVGYLPKTGPSYSMNGVPTNNTIYDDADLANNFNCASLIRVLSIDEKNADKNSIIHGYPNPFSNMVVFENISDKVVTCKVFDILGKHVSEFTLEKNSNKIIDLTGNAPGVYFMKTDIGSTIRLIKTE